MYNRVGLVFAQAFGTDAAQSSLLPESSVWTAELDTAVVELRAAVASDPGYVFTCTSCLGLSVRHTDQCDS
jgi:hypothetical protein